MSAVTATPHSATGTATGVERPHGLQIPAAQLVMNSQIVTRSLAGSARDIEETVAFAVTNGIRPVLERMRLHDAAEAVERVRRGDARFRIVLEPVR